MQVRPRSLRRAGRQLRDQSGRHRQDLGIPEDGPGGAQIAFSPFKNYAIIVSFFWACKGFHSKGNSRSMSGVYAYLIGEPQDSGLGDTHGVSCYFHYFPMTCSRRVRLHRKQWRRCSHCGPASEVPLSLSFCRLFQGINRLGLRVVLDVVYNHVFSTGPESVQSNFDKVRRACHPFCSPVSGCFFFL